MPYHSRKIDLVQLMRLPRPQQVDLEVLDSLASHVRRVAVLENTIAITCTCSTNEENVSRVKIQKRWRRERQW